MAIGARPKIYQRRVVRNNRTGLLEEIDIHELPPEDEGDEGEWYFFSEGKQYLADHPGVLAKPQHFAPVEG